MALELKMELRVDYDTANKRIKEPVIIERFKQLAAEILTIAELTADSRKPTIAVQIGDMFMRDEEVKLHDANSADS